MGVLAAVVDTPTRWVTGPDHTHPAQAWVEQSLERAPVSVVACELRGLASQFGRVNLRARRAWLASGGRTNTHLCARALSCVNCSACLCYWGRSTATHTCTRGVWRAAYFRGQERGGRTGPQHKKTQDASRRWTSAPPALSTTSTPFVGRGGHDPHAHPGATRTTHLSAAARAPSSVRPALGRGAETHRLWGREITKRAATHAL
jgi:hypothetical protein